MDLEGKVAIVTGGAVRMGRAIALALAERGVRLCLHYGASRMESIEVADAITAKQGDITTIQADLRQSTEAAHNIVQHAFHHFGHVDFLINNAAIFETATLKETSEENWDRHMGINLKTPFFLCQSFASRLEPDQPGHIVNITDWRVLRPVPGHLSYMIAKSGLAALTRILAQELAPHVQVNAIAPGAVLPPPGATNEYLQTVAQRTPLQRPGNVRDIVDAVLFLLESDFITGAILPITGGAEL